MKINISAKNVTYFAILLALVVVLQTTLGSIRIGATSFSVVLIPIVIGAILLGEIAGGLLGLAFGLIVLIYGITGIDVFTNYLFVNQPVLTVLTCLVKGIMAGVVPAFTYRLLSKKNVNVATVVSSMTSPIVNTGLFIVGALLMYNTLSASPFLDGQSVMYFLIIGCAGINFLVELLVNIVVAPAIARFIQIIEKRVS